jgi:hypothetical protein
VPKPKLKGENPLLVVPPKNDLLEELMRVQDDDIDEEGYSISLDLVVEAWRRFRPVNNQQEKEGSLNKRASEVPRT